MSPGEWAKVRAGIIEDCRTPEQVRALPTSSLVVNIVGFQIGLDELVDKFPDAVMVGVMEKAPKTHQKILEMFNTASAQYKLFADELNRRIPSGA